MSDGHLRFYRLHDGFSKIGSRRNVQDTWQRDPTYVIHQFGLQSFHVVFTFLDRLLTFMDSSGG